MNGRREGHGGSRRWIFFAISWVIIALVSAYIIAPAPIFVPLMEALGVGNAAVGAFVSVPFLSAIAVQLPGGYLIDRVSNRRIAAAAVLGLGAVTLPAALSLEYRVLLVSRLLAGVFLPLIFVSLTNLVGSVFAGSRLRALGIFLAAPSAGHALGVFATPHLASVLGLSNVFVVYTLPILALLPIGHWASRGAGADRGPMVPLRQYVAAFRSRELWVLGIAFACTLATYVLFTSWVPSYLSTEGGLSPQTSGELVALLPALGVLSIPLGGFLAATRLRGDRRAVPLLSFLLLLPLTLLWLDPRAPSWALVLIPLVGFASQLPIGVYYALSTRAMPERLTGSAYAFLNVVSMAGGVTTPLAGGYLLDLAGSFQPVFVLAAGFSLLGLAVTPLLRKG